MLLLIVFAFPCLAEGAPDGASPDARRLTLDEAFRLARGHTTELLAAKERLVQAELGVARAWALLRPTWTAAFTYTHSEPQPEAFPAFPNLGSTAIRNACPEGITLDQIQGCFRAIVDEVRAPSSPGFEFALADTLVFTTRVQWNVLNGRAIPLLATAEAAVDLEREQSATRERALLLGVARAFYAVAAAEESVATARRNDTRARERDAVERQRAAVGEESQAKRLIAEIALRQGALDLARAENLAAQARLALALTLGIEDVAGVEPPPEPSLPGLGSAATDEDATFQRAAELRPDIKAARLALAMAEQSRDEVWWRFAPVVGFFAGYRATNVKGLSGQQDEWSAGISATLQLYDGGLRYQDLAEAESRIRAARLTVQGLEARLRTEIRQAHLRAEGAALAIQRAQETLAMTQERLALSQTQFEAGAAREIDLQEAGDAVLEAERAVVRARLDRALAILEAEYAMGLFQP